MSYMQVAIVTCDKCGTTKKFSTNFTYDEARKYLMGKGWLALPGRDLCPDCRNTDRTTTNG